MSARARPSGFFAALRRDRTLFALLATLLLLLAPIRPAEAVRLDLGPICSVLGGGSHQPSASLDCQHCLSGRCAAFVAGLPPAAPIVVPADVAATEHAALPASQPRRFGALPSIRAPPFPV